MILFVRLVGIFVALAICLPVFSEQHPTSPFEALLEQVRAERKSGNAADRERERVFLERRDDRQRLLDEAGSRLDHLMKTSESLEQRFNANELELAELRKLRHQRGDASGELPDVFYGAVSYLEAQFADSLATLSIEDQQRSFALLRERKNLLTTEQLDDLMLLFLELMRMQALNLRLVTDVVSPDGEIRQRSVVRVGPFTAFAGGDFLSYLPGQDGEAGQLFHLPQSPARRYVVAAETFASAAGGIVAAPVDISRGSVLSLLIRSPTLIERIEQGGIIGYVILFIGVVGLLLGVERVLVLARAHRSVDRQSNDVGCPRDNPLGRVLLACEAERIAGEVEYEVLELKLDGAVMKEIPALEKRLAVIKVLAAIAPLLGLLGTVTGMIETLQVVTLFGTGDPEWMAGGIGQALVTTALGLVVALPMLLLHTMANAHSRAIREILEAQSAGLLAQYIENRKQ